MATKKTLHFKFQPEVEPTEKEELLRKLGEQGAGEVEALFPDIPNEQLSSLYSLKYQGKVTGQRLMTVLNESSSVEFAEEPAKRGLEPKPSSKVVRSPTAEEPAKRGLEPKPSSKVVRSPAQPD
jgi:hypothetical protein